MRKSVNGPGETERSMFSLQQHRDDLTEALLQSWPVELTPVGGTISTTPPAQLSMEGDQFKNKESAS